MNRMPAHLNALAERLRGAGLKRTPVRLAILHCLAAGHNLLSIDELVQRIHAQRLAAKNACDWSTVYRSLLKLQEAGLVSATRLGETQRFELLDETRQHHHHVICRRCRVVKPLGNCELQTLNQLVERLGYSEVTHQLEFVATCNACRGE